jgi:hypothetical protein
VGGNRPVPTDGRFRVGSITKMTKMTSVSPGCGLGLEWQELRCGVTVFGHGGGIPGYSSIVLISEDTRKRLEGSITSAPDPVRVKASKSWSPRCSAADVPA